MNTKSPIDAYLCGESHLYDAPTVLIASANSSPWIAVAYQHARNLKTYGAMPLVLTGCRNTIERELNLPDTKVEDVVEELDMKIEAHVTMWKQLTNLSARHEYVQGLVDTWEKHAMFKPTHFVFVLDKEPTSDVVRFFTMVDRELTVRHCNWVLATRVAAPLMNSPSADLPSRWGRLPLLSQMASAVLEVNTASGNPNQGGPMGVVRVAKDTRGKKLGTFARVYAKQPSKCVELQVKKPA